MPDTSPNTAVWLPSRNTLRELLEDSEIVIGERPLWARTIDCTFTAAGELTCCDERSLHSPYGPVLAERPAPVDDQRRQELSILGHKLIDCIQGHNTNAYFTATFALGLDTIHLEQIEGCEEPPRQADTGHHIELTIYNGPAAQLQGLRGPDQSIAGCDIHVLTQVGQNLTAGQAVLRIDMQAEERSTCIEKLITCLSNLRCDGLETNRTALLAVLQDERFRSACIRPNLVQTADDAAAEVHIEQAGLQSTVQDWPGRTGYWEVGVPPSGPMDDLGFRLANEAVGNPVDAAGIEITLSGFVAVFPRETTIAIAGAKAQASVDGKDITAYTAHTLSAGSRLVIKPPAKGLRVYLAVRGGIDTALYLGSRSTFTLGHFGGWHGRELRNGDRLPIGDSTGLPDPKRIAAKRQPRIKRQWQIGVRIGPHTSPDYLTAEGVKAFFGADWEVSPQSNRTGIRLLGPNPDWARSDGGEAGLHPSNLHDNGYAFGAIDLTGDLPVILGPDGPSLGGFVCPGIVVAGQRWKLGQLRPGDTVRFVIVDADEAKELRANPAGELHDCPIDSPVISSFPASDQHPGRCLRRQGDEFLLVEFGAMELDLELRLRVQSLYTALNNQKQEGIIDLVPGIRSLQIHFDPDVLKVEDLATRIAELDDGTASDPDQDIVLPSRTVHLPLSWDDPSTRKAIEIYMQTVNPDAPWCPWNIEFIRRINGLDSVEQVKDIVFNAEYLVYGLGDVYLGAPVATPVDPRHRLVTTKYNPARTWTPENAVGIGGAYLCIYGMEGPGGYQFVGRTVQVWNSYPESDCFAGKPWLLQQFDRLRFYPVSAEELMQLREDFPAGRWQPRIEAGNFSLTDYRQFIKDHSDDIARHRQRQQRAFAEERARWDAAMESST